MSHATVLAEEGPERLYQLKLGLADADVGRRKVTVSSAQNTAEALAAAKRAREAAERGEGEEDDEDDEDAPDPKRIKLGGDEDAMEENDSDSDVDAQPLRPHHVLHVRDLPQVTDAMLQVLFQQSVSPAASSAERAGTPASSASSTMRPNTRRTSTTRPGKRRALRARRSRDSSWRRASFWMCRSQRLDCTTSPAVYSDQTAARASARSALPSSQWCFARPMDALHRAHADVRLLRHPSPHARSELGTLELTRHYTLFKSSDDDLRLPHPLVAAVTLMPASASAVTSVVVRTHVFESFTLLFKSYAAALDVYDALRVATAPRASRLFAALITRFDRCSASVRARRRPGRRRMERLRCACRARAHGRRRRGPAYGGMAMVDRQCRL